MYRCKSWDEFRRRLAPTGITVEFYNDRDTGKPQGIRFSDGDFTFNGLKIDRAFSYKRLDKFFAKNAGIREAHPQQSAPISVTTKVKESPVANVGESIIETGCQAIGGLFQVGPGYDPEEEAFIRAMKKETPKEKRKITVMADLYSLVKKQDEKIDDLLKTAKENKDLLVGIDTRLVSDPAPSQTASPVSSGPQKILVELPDNVATNESIGKMLDEKLPSASTNETVNNMLAALPDSLSNGVAKILTDNINGKVKDALYEGFRKEFAKERKALYDVVSDLRYKVQSLVTGQWWLATPKWVYLIFSVLLLTSIGLGIWCYHLNQENTHLQKVEWLYRYERISYDAEGIRNMILREEAMMVGNRQEQDSIKAMTIRHERRKRAERTHVYFRPSDPWTPESNNHLW